MYFTYISQLNRWCLISISRTPFLTWTFCGMLLFGTSQSIDKLKANWDKTLQKGIQYQVDNFSKQWYVLVVTPSPFHMCTTIGIAPSPLSMHLFYGNYLYSSIWYQWYLYLDMGELCTSVPYSHDWWVNSWGFASYWKLTINCPYR